MPGPSQQHGFTLIELMLTVAIVGILGAVAVPGYREYARRAVLPQAFADLSDARIKLEQYYQSNRNYGAGEQCAGTAGFMAAYGAAQGQFDYSCVLPAAGNAQTYVLQANGKSGAAVGHTYTLDQNNVRATLLFKGQAVNRPCWLAKGGEC